MVVGDILACHLNNPNINWSDIGPTRCLALIQIALFVFKLKTAPEEMPDESFRRQSLAQLSIIFSRVISHGIYHC